jgi:hypothetical protein
VFYLLSKASRPPQPGRQAAGEWLKKSTVDTLFGPLSFNGPNNHGPARMLVKQNQGGRWVWSGRRVAGPILTD